MSEIEEWRDIPGYPDYQASSLGNIRSLYYKGRIPGGILFKRPRIRILKNQLKITRGGKQYFKVHLGRSKQIGVHCLIALAFRGVPSFEKAEAAHKDDDGLNNRETSIVWMTHQQNAYTRNYAMCECSRPYDEHDEDGQPQTPGPDCGGYKSIKKGRK